MIDTDIVAAYAGARVTQLVDRVKVLKSIRSAIKDQSGKSYVFYVEAEGGTGKTFLARHVLGLCAEEGDWFEPGLLAARHEIDLYHYQARSPQGFMEAFVQALPGDCEPFGPYRTRRAVLDGTQLDRVGVINERKQQQRSLLTETFVMGCQELTKSKRLVVVLDTAERLTYETDRIQRALRLGQDSIGLRQWLLQEWLPHVHNAVILICSRPPRKDAEDPFPAALKATVSRCPGMKFRAPKLGDFTPKETEEYIEAVRQTAKQDHNYEAQQRLDAISQESRLVIHHLTGGRPITLALIIDYYLVSERLLSAIKVDPTELEALRQTDPDQLEARRELVRGEIVRLFRETDRPADDAIVNLAWTPMGMDAELLSRVAEIPLREAAETLQVLSNSRAGLSFVKIRRSDGRAFLHDEMYKLLQDHVLSLMPVRRKRVYQQILAYYEEKIRAQEKRVRALDLEQRAEPGADAKGVPNASSESHFNQGELVAALEQLDDLRIEDVYYRLRNDPLDGFAQYCEYAEAAVTSNNDNLDQHLRDQMLTFVREHYQETDVFCGLPREAVERDSALRWGWRSVYAARSDEAYRLVRYLREVEPEFILRGGPLALSELDIIEGWATAFLGEDIKRAEEHLQSAASTLSHFSPDTRFAQLRKSVLQAQAYNVLGYVLRVQGRFQAACDSYKRALPLWRALRREADHAEVLNNLSWAYAEAGNFRRALRCCGSGLDLRERLGYRYLIALSYNTLGLIEIKNDQPHRGMVHCKLALDMFRELGLPRGMGLACISLAEAYRRSAATRRLYPPGEQINRLRLAEEYARSAVDVFDGKVQERLRLVEALNELGCVYRNWATISEKYYAPGDPFPDDRVKMAEEKLERAAKEASGTFAYREVDALVNLAWLYFYVEPSGEKAEAVISRVDKIFTPEYRIVEGKGLPKVENPSTFFWVQLSKIHVLLGEIAMRRYWRTERQAKGVVRDEQLLAEASKQFTLALAYSELFGNDYRDMRAAKDSIYNEFSRVNIRELRAIYQAVKKTATDYDLEARPAGPAGSARPRLRNFLEENFGPVEELGDDGPAEDLGTGEPEGDLG